MTAKAWDYRHTYKEKVDVMPVPKVRQREPTMTERAGAPFLYGLSGINVVRVATAWRQSCGPEYEWFV